jgi:hypothetical protein
MKKISGVLGKYRFGGNDRVAVDRHCVLKSLRVAPGVCGHNLPSIAWLVGV